MGSFRTSAARVADQAVLTAADRPANVPATDSKGRPNWLAEGESITYWTRLTHGAARRIATAATHATVDRRGRVSGAYDVGEAAGAKLAEGIVDWAMFDTDGKSVAWDRRQAGMLLDGLPALVLKVLADRIGNDEPAPATPPAPDGETPEADEPEADEPEGMSGND